MDHVNQSMHGMVVQQQLAHHTNGHSSGGYMSPLREHRSEKNDDEMSQLRTAVQRLMADNEHKSLQINTLRNALDEQMRSRVGFYASFVKHIIFNNELFKKFFQKKKTKYLLSVSTRRFLRITAELHRQLRR